MFAPGTGYVFLTASIAAAGALLPCVWNSMTPRSAASRSAAAWAVEAAALIPTLVIFAVMLPLLPFAYAALGSVVWPLSTVLLSVAALALMPLLAAAHHRARRVIIVGAGLIVVAALLRPSSCRPIRPTGPSASILNTSWMPTPAARTGWRSPTRNVCPPRSPARPISIRPRSSHSSREGASPIFYAPAPRLNLAAPELNLVAPGLNLAAGLHLAAPELRVAPMTSAGADQPPAAASSATAPSATVSSAAPVFHYDLLLRSARGAPDAWVLFPASASIKEVTVMTRAGPSRAKLRVMHGGATRLDFVGLASEGVEFGIDAAGAAPLSVQVYDRSYDFTAGEFLRRARPPEATSSQGGDVTVVHRTVSLHPAAGR